MGLVGTIYKKVCLISPWVEVALRKVYWRNVKYLKRFAPYGGGGVENAGSKERVDFEEIVDYLKSEGVGEGSLLVIHSSYDTLSCTGLKPQEIIQRLRDLVGETGTIAMPAIRMFAGAPQGGDLLKKNRQYPVCEYNVKRTPVTSGMLPFTLLRMKGSYCSHFPFNPIVAIGRQAEEMMEHNLDSERSSAHGKGSCWKYCLDHGAVVVGLGVDLEHHNTMCHVMEEAFDGWRWSDEEWYEYREFELVDENGERRRIKVRNRRPEWGMLCDAELNLTSALYKNDVIHKTKIGEIPVGVEYSKVLQKFLQSRNSKGFPYFKIH